MVMSCPEIPMFVGKCIGLCWLADKFHERRNHRYGSFKSQIKSVFRDYAMSFEEGREVVAIKKSEMEAKVVYIYI